MDYSQFISKTSASRKPSAIRELAKLNSSEVISLGGGYPNPSQYPIESISLTLKTGESLDLNAEQLSQALQYGPTQGLPKLLDILRDIQKTIHKAPVDFDIVVGNGSQDLITKVYRIIDKAFEMLLEPGDTMLIESPTYVGILAFLRPYNVKFQEINGNSEGLDPKHLAEVLDNWPADKSKPKVLYTVPVAGNPTGISTSLGSKQSIYSIAQKHNLIIMEDDPYYYLQFGDLVPSYLSMDTDGRVLRFDSFSKIISGGARLGFCTGPKELIDRIVLHLQATSLHVSGLSQMFIYKILANWGVQGFQTHTKQVAEFYKQRKDFFISCLTKYLTGLAEWQEPNAGMFVWIKLLGVNDSFELITTKAREAKIILVPGQVYYIN